MSMNEDLTMVALAKAAQASSAAGSASAAAADADRAEAAAQEAMSGTPTGYSNIVGSIAETFSSSKAYAAGDYVLKDSVLYRFTAAHAAGAWTGSDATAVNLGDEASDLKSAMNDLVIIDNTQPSSENNKIWIYSTGNSVQVPTMDDLYNILPTKTVTDVATALFVDGADDAPAKSCKVDITPVQAGSGDPSPDNVRGITGFTSADIFKDIEYNADATADIHIAFPADAGTVYGGIIDLVNKKLIVTHKSITYNGSVSESWTYDPSGGYHRWRITITDSVGGNTVKSVMCNIGKYANGANVADSTFKYSRYYYYIPEQTISATADFRVFLSTHNLQFIYPLAEQITYDIDCDDLKTLLGDNAIWASTGNINELKYRCDIKLYVDNAILSI